MPRKGLAKDYDEAGNPVDVNSQDFLDVMTWLRSKGVPKDPIITREMGTGPNGTFENINLIWDKGHGSPVTALAYLVMNGPTWTLQLLEKYFGFGDPDQLDPEYEPPVQPTPIPPKPEPIVLVGQRIGLTNMYQPVQFDDSPDGTAYQDTRGRFVKRVIESLIGNSVYWLKVG